ncbi:alpha/beta hydrolase family protein [Ceratobasidium sp. AG-Ba]|nr:alpha/beta hydrolase family protein [Ceratobasidium sp. AG-Ba]
MNARLSGLPRPQPPPVQARAPWAFPEDTLQHGEEDEQEEEDGLGDLPPRGRSTPTPARRTASRPAPTEDYSPISASSYLSQAAQASVPDSGLDVRIYYTPPTAAGREGTVLVCHHGAGYSSLSFACFAKSVGEQSARELGILIYDARGHGKTTSANQTENLDLSVIASDMVNLLSTVFPDPASAPSFVLLGHSMGGTAVVHACPQLQQKGYRVAGVAVLDVVEGSAMEALPHMHKLLESRPDGFGSVEEAVGWHLKNNTIRNPTSARISVPSLVVPAKPGESPAWKWRTPLKDTSPYWTSWFKGLSDSFLAARTARLLVLAGTDRLDKTLMIGQMQGKFQMVVVPDVGHMLHEDNPERLAEIIVEFWRRNERVVAGIKKVGEL